MAVASMPRMARRHLGLLIGVLALFAIALAIPSRVAASTTPFAGGDSAANIDLPSADRWIVNRWVAKRTGTLAALYLQVKTEGSAGCPWGGRPGYAKGTTGRFLGTTHRVLPDGRPDMSVTLRSTQFTPCGYEVKGSVRLPMGLDVVAGEEYATVVRNIDPAPSANYFSQNFLWTDRGVAGANGRNERDPQAPDAYYGLDPRELVGFSTDGGTTWALPGGPYGGAGDSGRAFIPTYIQKYADGAAAGQPYYWAAPVSGTVSMVFPDVRVPWTISALGAYAAGPGASVVALEVDGRKRASAVLSGTGMLRAPIPPVQVPRGATVRVTTVAGSGGLGLYGVHPDATWAGIYGLGTAHRWYMAGSAQDAVPVYPLPMYGTTEAVSGPLPAPPPALAPTPRSAPTPTPTTTPTPAPRPSSPVTTRRPPRPDLGPNRARAMPARASSSAGPRFVPKRANDGRLATRWMSSASRHPWWQVDLRRPVAVSSISLNWGGAVPEHYRVGLSRDGVRFTPLTTAAAATAGWWTTATAPRTARYVRVTVLRRSGAKGVSLRDARVFGTARVANAGMRPRG
jgi:hypothetical protein